MSTGPAAGWERAVLWDGENLQSDDDGLTWQPAAPLTQYGVPPCTWAESTYLASASNGENWALCVDLFGVGNAEKAVYRLPKREAETPVRDGGRPR